MMKNLGRMAAGGARRKTLACLIAVMTGLAPAQPAFAQRRSGEPEANADFRQQAEQGPSSASEPEAGGSSESGPVDPAPSGRVQGVQIGSTGAARPAAASPGAPLETRIFIRVKDAPLASFLDSITAQAKVSFIMAEGLENKKVTAFLQNVTVREALQILLEIKGLTYQQIGKSNTYVVAPRSKTVENLITRIYTLSYIPLISIGAQSSEQESSAPSPQGSGAGGGGAGGGGASMGASKGGGSSDADSGVAIMKVLGSVLSKSGQVAIEPRTNSLVVTDIPEVFPQIEQIIAELDKKAPQVMIEAQIVEIDSNRARDLGFEWGGPNGELGSFTGGARDTQFPLNLPNGFSKLKFFDPVDPEGIVSGLGGAKAAGSESASDAAAGSVIFGSNMQTGLVNLTALKVSLRALVSRSEARFLGKPKILTLNNKKAKIEVSQHEAVGLQISAASVGTTGAQTVQGAERVWTGLMLEVTPQVNKEGYITMLVQPSFTNVKEANISTANNRIFDRIIRGASTLVRIRNNQTLVLGGLLQSTEQKVTRKVPVLGYIPILGWLFTSSSTRRANSDLVIFITPTIVSD
jgi:type II secretory pathway component GspD/PulD (secretin)